MMTKITLEDRGQDILWFKVNEDGIVEESGPFQNEIWKDAYIPFRKIRVGPIAPHILLSVYHIQFSTI